MPRKDPLPPTDDGQIPKPAIARKRRDESPPANEFGKIRSMLAREGVKQADIKAVIGDQVKGRTRHEIANDLRAWLKTRPKAQ